METDRRSVVDETLNRPSLLADEACQKARAQAFEEAVSLALFASAWLQHSLRDPRASSAARVVAHLLAACSNRPAIQGPDAFAVARQVLEEECA
jgi:hypothetical protein